jgi:hypothetical protein
MEGWPNYREWFQKNENKKIKSIFQIYTIFPVISHFGEVLIFFPKKKKSE